MIKLDYAWLAVRGLDDLNVQANNRLLDQVYCTVEERIGERITDGMTDEQFREFDAALEEGEVRAFEWIDINVTNHRHVAAEVLDEIREELRARAAEILARWRF